MEGLSLFFFLLKGGERGRNRGKKGALEPHFPFCSYLLGFLPALSHLLEEKANFWKNSCPHHPPINQCPHPLFFGREGRAQTSKREKKQGETWSKEGTRKRGLWRQLLERLVRDFQPLTSVRASSPT